MNISLFDQFESEIVASTQLPYCQIQNPPNLALSQIEQLNPPWGWFIPNEQAQLSSFNATDDWQPIRLTFAEDTSNPRVVDGFLATHLRIVVLHQSNIEVQEKVENGWSYSGLAYQYGQLTKSGELAYSDRDRYRLRTRYLVVFLDDNNQLLSSTPFQIGMNAGVGVAFGTELKEFRKEIETIFFAELGKPQQQLSHRAHSLTVLDIQLGLHKSQGKAPFIYPQLRQTPEKNTTLTRRDRSVELVHRSIESMIIAKKSDVGQTILSFWSEYKSFSDRYQDDTVPEEIHF